MHRCGCRFNRRRWWEKCVGRGCRRAGAGRRCDWRRHWRYRREGRVRAFIATLVMITLYCARGVTMVYTDGSGQHRLPITPRLFGWFGIGRPLGVPTPVWIMAIVFYRRLVYAASHRLGRHIYALGGNEAATRLSGISVSKVEIIVYSLCGLATSLAGIVKWHLSSAQPTAGTGYELDAIAAVVLGGTILQAVKRTHCWDIDRRIDSRLP